MKKGHFFIVTVFLALAVVILPISAYCEVRVARMFSGEGLENSTYTSFCMDSFGFMWIGTDNGLIRSDGNHFIPYRHDEKDASSISDNRILGILRDINDRIWIATANGLNLMEESKDSFRKISVPDFGEKGYIVSLTCDDLGNITFVVAGVGIYTLTVGLDDEISVRRIDTTESLKNVNCILSHNNGSLYAGTGKGTIYELKNGKVWTKITQLKSAVFDMSQESNGSIIINSFRGVYRLDPGTGHLDEIHFKEDVLVNNLSLAVGDWIYVATYGAGVWKIGIELNVAEYCSDLFSPFINMKHSRIGAIYCDSYGSLWVGCDFFGVLMFPDRGHSFVYRSLSNIVSDFEVPLSAMTVWKGNAVIGNSTGHIAVVSEDGNVITKSIVPGGHTITSIDVSDSDKALLGVMDSGVWEFDLNSGNLKKIIDISDKYLSVEVCSANDGYIYVGLYAGGLLRFDPKTGEKTWISPNAKQKEVISPYITTIKAYGDQLWIGSYGGLACYNTSTRNFEDIDQSFYMACAVFDIVPENENSVLIGTSNGLVRYNQITKEMINFTTLEGVSDNDVKSIAIDGEGGIWIGTMRGINHQKKGDGRIVAYAGGNGIVERTFENMKYSAETDKIFASGRLGFTCFTPDSISLPVFDTPLKVTTLFLKGKKVSQYDLSDSYDVIDLPYDENSIAFRISTMDFRDTSNLRYLWRFSGDKDWVALPDGSDIINLSSLSPGRYSLEFKAEEAGIESPVSVIGISVAHPWYLTWPAKIIYILILLVLVSLSVIVLRKRNIERINARRMQFYIDMSHDMRSPLTLILGPLESMLKEELSEDLRKRIRGVYRNAHRILSTVNQFLDLKKVDYGRKSLKCIKTNLSEFIREIVDMFQPQAIDKGIDLSLISECDWVNVWIDRSVIDRIMVNLISNAIKYTPANGTIKVVLGMSNDNNIGECIKISVSDNGIGLDSNFPNDLFDRYVRLENGTEYSEDGFGIGLDICRRYVMLHHGEIYGENRKNGVKGSTFTVLIPIDECKYTEDELTRENTDMAGEQYEMALSKGKSDVRKRHRNVYAESKILVVEDDVYLRKSLYDYFKDYYKVSVAADGEDGYKLAQELIPDVIITDVKMPRSDGLQLLRQLKFNEATNHIPVVILSSKSELADRISGWKQGAEAYVGKPFNYNELRAIVFNLIDGRKKLEGNLSDVVEKPDKQPNCSMPYVKGNDEVLIERVDKILDERIDEEDMNVDKLSEALGVSRTHLYRRMKDRLGMNPSDYIRTKRLQRACELLKNDDLDVTQIAYILGFSSQSQFSTTFKRFMGYTPTEYRSKYSKEPIRTHK